MNIGVCTCERGQDGSPCVHQAAVVLNFGVESLNYIATLTATARLKIATIVLGSGAVKQLSFYTSKPTKRSLKRSSIQLRINVLKDLNGI